MSPLSLPSWLGSVLGLEFFPGYGSSWKVSRAPWFQERRNCLPARRLFPRNASIERGAVDDGW